MAIAMNGGGSKEGNGDGEDGGEQAMATATKRELATAMRVVGKKEGNWDKGESNGNRVEGGRQW